MLPSKRITTYSNGNYTVEAFSQPPLPQTQLWMHKEDAESGIFVGDSGVPRLRKCAYDGGCPAVFVLMEPNEKVEITEQWQYYLIGINYLMTLQHVSDILDHALAFANGTGLTKPGVPRRNYILGVNLDAEDERGNPALPKFDKDRTCSRSTMTGVEVGDYLKVTTLNGNLPPPLKAGKSYPRSVAEINPDDYLYHPKNMTQRHLFFAANVVASKSGGRSSVAPFPRGAIYPWTGDNLPYTWLPHVSRKIIYYPKSKLVKLPLGSPIPSPYRIVR